MTQIKIFGSISDAVSSAKEATEKQVNDWLRDELPQGATVQVSSAMTHANGKFQMMITIAFTTAESA